MVDNVDTPEEQPVLTPTPIYRCKDPACKAWVREEYLPADQKCPMCKGPMSRSMKHLPALTKGKKKRAGKGKG
ncbi:hypothetical protein SY83_00995 [Paenibacillus swuensis]|uniref:Cold-shock protein n=1 Tax=Paenibacillus swuensis TaxID=1178515 RepID=A0A172TDN8_9BACL|nr:cold-inducible protein YdjO-related protein [Paenibacillus swuensis]ANE45149.1 hypothetical protein SY83_00995 [Paenibacillus swuensis]